VAAAAPRRRDRQRLSEAHGGAYDQGSWDGDNWAPQDDEQDRPSRGSQNVRQWR
jgi:hypothetical protein